MHATVRPPPLSTMGMLIRAPACALAAFIRPKARRRMVLPPPPHHHHPLPPTAQTPALHAPLKRVLAGTGRLATSLRQKAPCGSAPLSDTGTSCTCQPHTWCTSAAAPAASCMERPLCQPPRVKHSRPRPSSYAWAHTPIIQTPQASTTASAAGSPAKSKASARLARQSFGGAGARRRLRRLPVRLAIFPHGAAPLLKKSLPS